MLGGIAAIVAIVFFVLAHEAGHFFAAKATGMKVTEFFFGFGPRLWSTKKGETEYGFKLVPLGGYVRVSGMNPLEEVPVEDMGRTYREKKFWEKSVVVLAGVGANFLLAFLLFYGLVVSNGIPELLPVVAEVVEGSAAEDVGLRVGDRIIALDGRTVDSWDDVPVYLREIGPNPTTITIERGGERLDIDVVLEAREGAPGVGFLGVAPELEILDIGPVEGVGVAGGMIGEAFVTTFEGLGQMIRPSSLLQYLGVLVGNTDLPDEIRPVSPIGIVNIGSQTSSLAFFLGMMATVNVILGTLNLLPLFPLDGGHFAVALYEKVTGRQANMKALIPVATAVIGIFVFLGLVAIILDIVNPIDL
ncbi:MAG TPA: M50 family metallopeptidase [Acidimicrobiia bacterium]